MNPTMGRFLTGVRIHMTTHRIMVKDLAARLNVSTRWLPRRFAGQTQLTFADADRIATALGRSFGHLLSLAPHPDCGDGGHARDRVGSECLRCGKILTTEDGTA